MKERHHSTGTGHTTVVRDESGFADRRLPVRPSVRASLPRRRASSLRNLELRDSADGQFLIFKTDAGKMFALNLDCQEEYGFEAKQVLQQWAKEQR